MCKIIKVYRKHTSNQARHALWGFAIYSCLIKFRNVKHEVFSSQFAVKLNIACIPVNKRAEKAKHYMQLMENGQVNTS